MHVIFKALPRNQPYSQKQRDQREKPGQAQTPHRTWRVAGHMDPSTAAPTGAACGWHVCPLQVTSPLLLPPRGRRKKPSWLGQGCSREVRDCSQSRGCRCSPHHHRSWRQLCPPAQALPQRTSPAFPSATSSPSRQRGRGAASSICTAQ